MRLSRKAPLILVGCCCLALGMVLALTWRAVARLGESHAEDHLDRLVRTLQAQMEQVSVQALARAELLADVPTVDALLAERNRAGLEKLMAPLIEVQVQKYAVEQANFYTQDNAIFLRVNSPEKGEPVDHLRPMTVSVNQRRESASGLEIGRLGPAIYGMVPVDYKGRPVGAFGIGMSMERLVDELHGDFGLDATALFDEHLLTEVVVGTHYTSNSLLGHWANLYSTNWALTRSALEPDNLEGLREPLKRVVRVGPLDLAVVVLPLKDFSGKVVGNLVALQNLQSFQRSARRTLVVAGLLAVLALVLLAGVIGLVINGMILRPLVDLTHRLDEVALGHATPLSDLAERNNEIGELARVYHKLRRPEPPDQPGAPA